MAYTYTLTNESKFHAAEFAEGSTSITLGNEGTVKCLEIREESSSIPFFKNGFVFHTDNKIYCNEFIEEEITNGST